MAPRAIYQNSLDHRFMSTLFFSRTTTVTAVSLVSVTLVCWTGATTLRGVRRRSLGQEEDSVVAVHQDAGSEGVLRKGASLFLDRLPLFVHSFLVSLQSSPSRQKQECTEEREVSIKTTGEEKKNEEDKDEPPTSRLSKEEEAGACPDFLPEEQTTAIIVPEPLPTPSMRSVEDSQVAHPIEERNELQEKKNVLTSTPTTEEATPSPPMDAAPRSTAQPPAEEKVEQDKKEQRVGSTARNDRVPVSMSSDHQQEEERDPADVADLPRSAAPAVVTPPREKKTNNNSMRESEDVSTVASSSPSSVVGEHELPILAPVVTPDKRKSMRVVVSFPTPPTSPRLPPANAVPLLPESPYEEKPVVVPDDLQSISSLESLASFHTSQLDYTQQKLKNEEGVHLELMAKQHHGKKHRHVSMAKWLSSINHMVHNKRRYHTYEHHRHVHVVSTQHQHAPPIEEEEDEDIDDELSVYSV